ncbi:hypothetical protein AB0E62_38835 [Streptomyces sp. NPDC038707]|uniref:hypothetical protein n=1 Tax=Streptomyces sp. NPDC038707 TaxID=3154329 RepID=UPI0033FFBF88
MPDFAHDEATARRALDVIDQLLAARDRMASGVGGVGFLREHEAVAPVAWSWWMLISDSARVVAEAAKNGNGFVVAPVMRNLMTHAVAMAWLVDGGGAAVQAVDAYSDDQLLKLITNAKRAGWDVGGDEVEAKVRAAVDERTAYPDLEVVRLTNEIRNTADLMAAFGEQEGYLPYRHLSSYSHTTRETAQLYLHPTRAGGWELRNKPRESGLNDVIWTAVCLIQAGRILDSILSEQLLAEELDQATAHLGVSGDIVPRRRLRRGAAN